MKRFYKVVIVILTIMTGFLVFFNTDNYIAQKNWKYRNGSSIGDWISFDKHGIYRISKGKVYRNNQLVATIRVCLGRVLIIRNLEVEKTGYYINK